MSSNVLFMQTHPSKSRFPFPETGDIVINPNDIHPEDIAYALSNQPRFGGHCCPVMSVAEHSWRVSYEVDPAFALAGLLHDAAEYLCVDVPTPIKALVPEYKIVERIIREAIAKRFGFDPNLGEEVKRADRVLFATEIRDLMIGGTDGWPVRCHALGVQPRRIVPMHRKLAEVMFLRRLDELTGQPRRRLGILNGLRYLGWQFKSGFFATPQNI